MQDNGKNMVSLYFVKNGYTIDCTDSSLLYDGIANGNIIPIVLFTNEDISDERDTIDNNVTQQVMGKLTEKRLEIIVCDDLHNLKNLSTLNSDKWNVYEVYSDGSIAGFNYVAPILNPFGTSLVYVDELRNENNDLPLYRKIKVNYKYPSQFTESNERIIPDYDPFDVDVLRDVKLTIVNNIVYVNILNDTSKTDGASGCFVFGLKDEFIDINDNPFIGITATMGGYTGFPEEKSIFLNLPIDQLNKVPMYNPVNSILTANVISDYLEEVISDDNNELISSDYE